MPSKRQQSETLIDEIEVSPCEPPADQEVIQEATTLARQPVQGESILSVIRDAVVNKADVAVMRELLAIRREERADLAREAFANALVQFRTLVKPIIMTGNRDDRTSGGTVHYQYAELTTTIEQIQPALDQCQLTPTWTATKNDPAWVEIDCIVTHGLGHKEHSMPVGAPVPQTGNRGQTPVQVRMGVITTLKRVTLFMVLGLVTKEDDQHLKDQEQGDDKPRAKSQDLLDKEEIKHKSNFILTCEKKTGISPLPKPILMALFAQAQALCGSQKAVDCLNLIDQVGTRFEKDGASWKLINDLEWKE